MREITDSLSSSSPYERVAFMKGAQIGGTKRGNNWLGYIIHHTPGPVVG
ncbi:MAG: phage terminase large subunit family protein [Bryobacteraceae bacterium]